MTGRRRWTADEILDKAAELLRTGDTESFSLRKLAAALGTDSSSLYRHFRNKTELLREVADRVLQAAMADHRTGGGGADGADWKERVTALALRLREGFGEQPQLAAIWGRYGSGGAGSRLVMEELLRILHDAGLPEREVPVRYHRLVVLLSALISAEGGLGSVAPEEYEQGLEQFRVAVLGADPERFPMLARFAREVRPLGADRRAAFEELLAAQLADIEASLEASSSEASSG
ncbi:TetR/AcrR family transcriptional regulator [Kitasatospora sp. NPDC001540]|uniref:TetR/AcrR family transcriptional regulator n=1 Tax=Kitasatospora sp. NPDC001540 TaxID=3364014 RepID=UPI0036A8D29D